MYEFNFQMRWDLLDELEEKEPHLTAVRHFTLKAAYFSDEDEAPDSPGQACAKLTGCFFDCTEIDGDFATFFDEDNPDDANFCDLFDGVEYADEVFEATNQLWPSSLILLHKLHVYKGHRGKRLSIKMLEHLGGLFDGSVDFIALKAFPIDFKDSEHHLTSTQESDEKKDPAVLKKLISLYEKAGFELIGLDDPIMVRLPTGQMEIRPFK